MSTKTKKTKKKDKKDESGKTASKKSKGGDWTKMAKALDDAGIKFYHSRPRTDFSAKEVFAGNFDAKSNGVRIQGKGTGSGYLITEGKNAGAVCMTDEFTELEDFKGEIIFPKLCNSYIGVKDSECSKIAKAVAGKLNSGKVKKSTTVASGKKKKAKLEKVA